MQEMLNNALGQHASFEEANNSRSEESTNDFTKRFYNLLVEANEPIFEGLIESKLSVCARLCPSNPTRMFPTKHWTTIQNSF